jgi:putative tricarboxylic transport membrane protein
MRRADKQRGCAAVLLAASVVAAAAPAVAQEFKGKTVTVLVGSIAGGGTDAIGRLVAPFLTKYLPGNPGVVVQNMPGADGVVAANYFVQQTKADGLTILAGDSPQIDPIRYRAPQSRYDPTRFEFVGGIGRGGSMIVMNSAAERRLHDASARPVTIGVAAALPRSGQLIAAWGIGFLGWNAKWIVGYRGTGALMISLQQGEIDMTATGNAFSLQSLIGRGKFKVLTQSGGLLNGKLVPRPEFSDAPLISNLLAGRLADPIAQKAFRYWQGVLLADKWLALPPGNPRPIIDIYRNAYRAMAADPEFNALGRRISEVFAPMSDDDISSLVREAGEAPREAVEFLDVMLHKQGITGL